MSDQELMREVLQELERGRIREREQRIEAEKVLEGLHVLATSADPITAGHEVLASLASILSADDACVLARGRDGVMRITASTGTPGNPVDWLSESLLDRTLHQGVVGLFDLSAIPLHGRATAVRDGSALLLSLRKGDRPALLVCTHPDRGRFGPAIIKLAGRMAPLASQALASIEMRRQVLDRDRFFAGSPNLVAILEPDGAIRSANSAWQAVLGVAPEEVVGTRIEEYVVPEDRTECAMHWAQILSTQPPVETVLRCRREDGTIVRIGWSCWWSEEGSSFYTLGMDVTARFEAQEEARRQQEFRKAVLDTAGAVVVVCDPAGRVVDLNLACEIVTGWRHEDLVGEDLISSVVPPEEQGTVRCVIEEMVRTRQPSRCENHWVTRSGGRVWISWSNTILRDDDGGVGFILATGIDMTERRLLEERLRHAAQHDPLTGLPNRASLQERMEQMLARRKRWSGYGFTLLYIDLDGFKDVNDQHGHDAGDRVLVQAAKRFLESIRRMDVVARVGGDEFAILLDGVSGKDDARVVARRIEAAFALPFRDGEHEFVVGASVGTAITTGSDQRAEDLLREADMAMYARKAVRKARGGL